MEQVKINKEGRGQLLYKEAKKIIPGGGQLLSKRPEKFAPEIWPTYYSKAKGCKIWDLDGNEYRDFSYMGIGACTLGYADDDVDAAVLNAIKNGTMTTLMVPEEVELAKLLLEQHPWADMVRYAKGGGDAMAVAVRIARAATKKDKVLFCGYHGWHDWYLSANLADDKALDGQLMPGLSPVGVARELAGTSYPFWYNKIEQFKKLIAENKDNLAGVVLEAARNMTPEADFFSTIEEECHKLNIPLIIDEVTSGFRMYCGGACEYFGIHPDIAVFAKGMANGYPIAAIIGKKKYMDAAQDSFISSTFWTERIGFVAAIATIKKYKALNVNEYLNKLGRKVQEGWTVLAEKHGLKIHISGIYPLGHICFEAAPLELKTLFVQEMLRRGFLVSDAYYASLSHTEEDVNDYLAACDEVFAIMSKAVVNNNITNLLAGPVCQGGFARLA